MLSVSQLGSHNSIFQWSGYTRLDSQMDKLSQLSS